MNVVASKIFVALCAYLLLAFQKFVSRSAMGTQAVLGLMQSSLFQRKPLANLLRGRKHDPPDPRMPLRLRTAYVGQQWLYPRVVVCSSHTVSIIA